MNRFKTLKKLQVLLIAAGMLAVVVPLVANHLVPGTVPDTFRAPQSSQTRHADESTVVVTWPFCGCDRTASEANGMVHGFVPRRR